MTSEDLKALVKEHFNLVEADAVSETAVSEETFGELKDINGAFTLKFPGDSLQVGDKVTVVTTEGQEMDAPDGEHMLEDGTKIVTKDSVVEEIMSADEEKEMATEEVKMEEVEIEVKPEALPAMEEVIKAIADAVEEKMAKMEEKLAAMEAKMEAFEASPAAEKTLPTSAFNKFEKVNAPKAFNSSTIEQMIDKIKNKK